MGKKTKKTKSDSKSDKRRESETVSTTDSDIFEIMADELIDEKEETKQKLDSESDESSEESISNSHSSSHSSSVSANKNLSLITLKSDPQITIRYVYHLSDIHIRNNQRHTEYKEVFERTYKTISDQIGTRHKESIIIITGDIMHSKTELSPEAIKFVWYFFKNLSAITTLIVIPGNHDCNLSNKGRLDAISPIVDDIGKLSNFYYLKKSGLYQLHNIIFGVTSIFDDILIPASKITKGMIKGITHKNPYLIALYHGAVHGAKTDVGYRMNNTQLLAKDFDGYDYVFLGDIHKYQYLNEQKTIAYAGSLIQQSYGETIKLHGVLKWDLFKSESKLLEIDNDYGYCTIKIVAGVMEETDIPPKPHIRLQLENTTPIQCQDIVKNLEKKYQIQGIVKDADFSTNATIIRDKSKKKKKNSDSESDTLLRPSSYETQETIIKAFLTKKGLEEDKITDVIDLHKKIYQQVLAKKGETSDSDSNDTITQLSDPVHNLTKNQRWTIMELKFSNMLSYGEGNIIDFRNYNSNHIIGIVAPNHYGKSAILDIILFCLFDKFTRSSAVRDILNKNKTTMSCSLMFRIGSQVYLIERNGHRSKGGKGSNVEISVNFFTITYNKKGVEKRECLNADTKLLTNKKIIELIGNYDDYLATCFSLQSGKNNTFLDMTQKDRKEYLNSILRLNVFEDCHKFAKNKSNELMAQAKLLEKIVGSKSIDDTKKSIKKIDADLNKLFVERYFKQFKVLSSVNDIIKTIRQKPLISYAELTEYNLKTVSDIDITIERLLKKITDSKNTIDIDDIHKKKIVFEDKMKTLNETLKTFRKDNDLSDKRTELESLLKQIVTVNKAVKQFDLDDLQEETDKINDRLGVIHSALENLFDETLSDKINRIDELKILILGLRKKLVTVPFDGIEDAVTKRTELKSRLATTRKEIETSSKIILSSTHLTDADIQKFNLLIEAYNEFTNDIGDLSDITIVVEEKCEQIHQKYSNRSLKMKSKIDRNSTDPNLEKNFNKMLIEEKDLKAKIVTIDFQVMTMMDNTSIERKITKAEAELDQLKEFTGTKREITNLKQETSLLEEKLILIKDKIKQKNEYDKIQESNLKINDSISKLKTSIAEIENKEQYIEDEIDDIQEEINILQSKEKDNEKQLKLTLKYTSHLVILKRYRLEFTEYEHYRLLHLKWSTIKKEIEHEISTIDDAIGKKNLEMKLIKNDLTQYMERRKDFDEVSTEANLYALYVQLMNYNGLPYEVLKNYLPRIEADVNQVLRSMVNFGIEFMFVDKDTEEVQNIKQTKTNAGCVDVNICYYGAKPYNVQLASGFEKFIIGLAIRMTLCQISLMAKPNFLIVDEGWSCLDTDNLNNVHQIMDYIKTQYEHVIVISHLDQLKNQSDYIINIDKKNGYSYINTTPYAKTDKKKKKKREVIVI